MRVSAGPAAGSVNRHPAIAGTSDSVAILKRTPETDVTRDVTTYQLTNLPIYQLTNLPTYQLILLRSRPEARAPASADSSDASSPEFPLAASARREAPPSPTRDRRTPRAAASGKTRRPRLRPRAAHWVPFTRN